MKNPTYHHLAQRAISGEPETGKIKPIAHNPFKEISGTIDGRHPFTFKGRLAPALINLMQAGVGGYTYNEQMAPFSSNDVSRLRKMMVIETIRWNGLDGSTRFHLRYVLRSQITITHIKVTE